MGSQATFLFADLAGFTTLTERDGDEAAADLALAFCDRVCELNRGHHAEDVKTLGDASMVISPRTGAGDPPRARDRRRGRTGARLPRGAGGPPPWARRRATG